MCQLLVSNMSINSHHLTRVHQLDHHILTMFGALDGNVIVCWWPGFSSHVSPTMMRCIGCLCWAERKEYCIVLYLIIVTIFNIAGVALVLA